MRYIINADDFGVNAAINAAIAEGFRLGCLTRASVIVNKPAFLEAADMSKAYGFQDRVGLHVNLTAGIPLTDGIRRFEAFCGNDGRFNGNIFRKRLLMHHLTSSEKRAVREEIHEQIEKFRGSGFTLKHADSHGHVHTFPSMIGIFLKEMRDSGFETVRISMNLKAGRTDRLKKWIVNQPIHRFNHDKCPIYFGSLKQVIRCESKLDTIDGKCEIMLHPNIWDGKIKIGEGLSYADIPESIKARMI